MRAYWHTGLAIVIHRRYRPLKITTERTGERQLALTIELDEERTRRARRQTARQISREVSIPGFRKGKAPYDAIVQRLGEEVVREELVKIVAEDAYREALAQEEIVAYAPGTLEEVAFDPLVLEFVVPLTPDVDLGEYRQYRRELPEVEVTDEEIERALQEIGERNAVLNPVERPAREGDVLVGHFTGRTSDRTLFLDEEEAEILLEIDGDTFIPGLIEALIGLEAEDEETFTLVLPEDFEVEALQGEEAEFRVGVDSVYERIIPDIDDDLARTVGRYDSLRELEEEVRGRLEERKEAQAESEYAEQVLQDIIEQAAVAYPPEMVEEGLDDAVQNYEVQVERREHMMLKDYLRIQGKTMDELRDELRSEVENTLKRSLVLGEIVEQEGLEISDVELDIQIAESSEQYGERADEVEAALSSSEGRRSVRNRMLANKAVQGMVAIAKGEAPEELAETGESQAAEDSQDSEEEHESETPAC